MIFLQGKDGSKPTQEVIAVDHVTLRGSASNGILLQDGAGFAAGSTDLTITGAKQYPVSIWSRAGGTPPSGTYTGNAHDEILLPCAAANETIGEDTTMRDRGVPYHAGHATSDGNMRVSSAIAGGLVTLTIEPGVVLRFKKGGVLQIEVFQGT